jgi:ParB family transcriptional regulator, chromosome partitioning protein
VLPALKGGERILDFGCGQADYVTKLARAGCDIRGVEFFARTGNAIDAAKVHRIIDRLCQDLTTGGRFDVVLADSVLNSIDTLQAEADVLNSLHALTRPGGRIYFSGRGRARFENRNKTRVHSVRNGEKGVVFMDHDGFSGVYHHGAWFYQKFCTPEQVATLAATHFPGCATTVKCGTDRWRVIVTKTAEVDHDAARHSLAREFDLPWPNGRRVGRSAQILQAYAAALALEAG